LKAAELLVARGDPAGARLLTMAVERLQPPVPLIQERQESLTPSTMHRYKWKVRILVALGLLLVPLGLVGVGALAIGGHLWRKRVRVPGLDLTDSQIWRVLNSARFDRKGWRVAIGREDVGAVAALAAFLSLIPGILLSELMLSVLASVFGVASGSKLPEFLQTTIWAAGLICPPVITILAISFVERRRRQSKIQNQRRHERRQWYAKASRCRCLGEALHTDDHAVAYAANHLVPTSISPAIQTVTSRIAPNATIMMCPDTGILWLGIDLVNDHPALLLRGTAPEQQDRDRGSGTGMYL
jgi:hypothetical protein